MSGFPICRYRKTIGHKSFALYRCYAGGSHCGSRIGNACRICQVPVIGNYSVRRISVSRDFRIACGNSHKDTRFFCAVHSTADITVRAVEAIVGAQGKIDYIGAQFYRIFNGADNIVAVSTATCNRIENLKRQNLSIRGNTGNPPLGFISVGRGNTRHMVAMRLYAADNLSMSADIAVAKGNFIGEPLAVAQLGNL